jgi:Skp family chaperone for outer membrane proteins
MRATILGLLAATMVLAGANTALAQKQKVGYVYLEVIRATAQPYKDAGAKLQLLATERQKAGAKLQMELQQMQQNYAKQEKILTEAAKQKKMQDFQAKQESYLKWVNATKQELALEEAKAIKPLDKRALNLIKKIAAEKKYDLVLDGNAVAYMADMDKFNITDDVVKALNQ